MNAAAVLAWFFALHMLGDYVTQNSWMAGNKLANAGVRFVHVLVYSLPFALLGYLVPPHSQLGAFGHSFTVQADLAFVWLFLAVFIPHFLIDSKRFCTSNPWPMKPIMVDQTLHAIHLAVVFSVFYGQR